MKNDYRSTVQSRVGIKCVGVGVGLGIGIGIEIEVGSVQVGVKAAVTSAALRAFKKCDRDSNPGLLLGPVS